MRISDWSSDVCSSDLEVAWYAAMRERFPGRTMFGLSLIDEADQNLSYNGLTLRLDQEMRDYLMAKWPNRADTTLLDRKSVLAGKSVSVRVDLEGRRMIKKTTVR